MQKYYLEHIVAKWTAAQERYANFILPTLAEPNEVWLTEYSDGFRRRFIKFFRGDKNMLVIVRENTEESLLWNAIPAEARYIDKQRTGILFYNK